ncbi:MAG: DEAD/DEAH box helicase [Vampirovibrionia bacterium]
MSIFSFELSDWQKRATDSIDNGGHCLVTAPTGSGKTVPAEYAIHHFTELGKKVIYTSPIKALSNQKYYEFQKKFPNVSFGILTGDIKDNPEADVLIMTTEILCNHLHNLKHPESKLEFDIDIHNELGCVVFDEVHYINDADRGTVWEECFMLLPEHIQLVMLSATIATPEKFAEWIESIHPESDKKVALCDTSLRAVPLTHYMWISATNSAFNCKDKKMAALMEQRCNQMLPLYTEKHGFYTDNYKDVSDIHYHLRTNNHIKRQFVLNQVVGHLKKEEMLPAICFVYSRKNVERFAKELTHSLNDSMKMTQVEKECRSVLARFPNASEYMSLPEYRTIVGLLEKGIGIHHSGLLPVFREMIELLFDKGYVQMLFATETFAVGLNMPTKTVLFTSLKKFNGSQHRYLLSHEYTQQAGRAGRRGYDTVGHVIHLSNLFDVPNAVEYKEILGNVPQKIVSKLKISYSMVMNCENPQEFIRKSAIQQDIQKELDRMNVSIATSKERVDKLTEQISKNMRTPEAELRKIHELENTIHFYRNKQRKAKERELAGLYDEYKFAKQELHYLIDINEANEQLEEATISRENTVNYVETQVGLVREILEEGKFEGVREEIARNIKEVHPLMMTDAFEKFSMCDAVDLITFFSCFTNINVNDEVKNHTPKCDSSQAHQLIVMADEQFNHYYNQEGKRNIYTGESYEFHYDLADVMRDWCDTSSEKECEDFLKNLQHTKGIFLGEFVKAVLKINAMAKELEKVSQICGMTDVEHTLSQIGELTLKSVCTSQSLYV